MALLRGSKVGVEDRASLSPSRLRAAHTLKFCAQLHHWALVPDRRDLLQTTNSENAVPPRIPVLTLYLASQTGKLRIRKAPPPKVTNLLMRL